VRQESEPYLNQSTRWIWGYTGEQSLRHCFARPKPPVAQDEQGALWLNVYAHGERIMLSICCIVGSRRRHALTQRYVMWRATHKNRYANPC